MADVAQMGTIETPGNGDGDHLATPGGHARDEKTEGRRAPHGRRARSGGQGRASTRPAVGPRRMGAGAGSAPIRSICSRSRRRRACPSWCRSATAGCSCRRSRSTAVRPTRWRPIWPPAPRTGLEVQLCGDAHLSNFGAFAAPDRRLIFSHQRLRRDAARPVRVGRQAPGRELRRRPAATAASTPSSATRSTAPSRAPTGSRSASSPR